MNLIIIIIALITWYPIGRLGTFIMKWTVKKYDPQPMTEEDKRMITDFAWGGPFCLLLSIVILLMAIFASEKGE